jgi:hypothetical protein
LNQTALKHQARFYDKMRPNYGPPENVAGNFNYNWPRNFLGSPLDLRLDHRLTSKNTLYGVFRFLNTILEQPATILPLDVIGPLTRIYYSRTFSLTDTHVFSPTVVNEFRGGLMRMNYDLHGPLKGREIIDLMGLTGFPGGTPDAYGYPDVRITGFQNTGQENHSRDIVTGFEFHDQLSWRKDRHNFKFGYSHQYNQVSAFIASPSAAFGQYSFDGSFSGHAYADYLLGLPRTSSRSAIVDPRYDRNHIQGLFAQDDWNVTPRLTVNLGLRYDRFGPFREKYDRLSNFDTTTGRLVVADAGASRISPLFPTNIPIVKAGQAGYPVRPLVNTQGANFGPRVGVAYRIRSNTVLRAGYGIFYDNAVVKVYGALTRGLFSFTETFDNTITNGAALFAWPQAFPAAGGPRALSTQDLNGANPNLRNTYSQQWNVSIGREFMDTAFRVSYIGTTSPQLLYQRNVNQPAASLIPFTQDRRPFPFVRNIAYTDNGGVQSFQALQIEANRRMRKGLSLNAHWTWASNISDSPDDSQYGVNLDDVFNRTRERSKESYTPKHRFVSNFVFEVPAGRGRHFLNNLNRFAEFFAGGWQISGIMQFQSGLFFTPSYAGYDPANTNVTTGRPDRISDGNFAPGQRTLDRWFDASAFVLPPKGRFGNAGRGILEGPGTIVTSAGIFKNFRPVERVSVRFQAKIVNALNHANFSNPAANISIPGTIGRITAVAGITEATAGPRAMQLGIRAEF